MITGLHSYTRGERLGAGGDAEVFAAFEPLTAAQVAIKRLHASGTTDQEPRLLREYQYLRDLDVDGVPRARGLGRDGSGRACLVMDRRPGAPAGRWAKGLRDAARTPRDAAAAIVPVLARAGSLVAAVHAAGVVHGDLKPSSFLVDGARVSLVDFGAGRPRVKERLVGRIPESFTTAAYGAPEALARRPATTASDVWSLSGIACRTLLGEPPFGDGTRQEVAARITPAAVDALAAALAERVSPEAVAALRAGLSHDPRGRPDALAWARALGGSELAAPAPTVLVPPATWPAASPVPPVVRALRTLRERGAWSQARARLLEPDLPRGSALMALAELELELGHLAVASDVLVALDGVVLDAHLAAARLTLTLQVATARGQLGPIEPAMAALASRPALEPVVVVDLAAALAIAAVEHGDPSAAEVALATARAAAGEDLEPGLLVATVATVVAAARGLSVEAPTELMTRAHAAGLHAGLGRLALARGDLAAARAAVQAFAPGLGPFEAMPLSLSPWLVEAERLGLGGAPAPEPR